MPLLYDEFIKHYCNLSNANKFRRLYEHAWNGIPRTNEVDAIKSFLLDPKVGIDFLNESVSKKINNSKFNMKFASIFCHKKPRVLRTSYNANRNPGKRPGCELGDLFVLFLLMDASDNIHYSSGALFQAKLEPKLDSATQRHLYDDDDGFILPKNLMTGRGITNSFRKMPTYSEGRGNALRYLILNPKVLKNHVQARHTPWSNDYQSRWSTFVDNLISGTDGLALNLNAATPNAWEQIAHDLLWMINSVKKNKPPRGNNVAANIATGLFNNYANYERYCVELEEGDGIPTMLIIAHSPEPYEEAHINPFERRD